MPVKTEHDYIFEFSNTRMETISVGHAKRAARIARMRGMMKAYKDDGCWGSYDNVRLQLKSLLKNVNKGDKRYRFPNN